ncbi:MAG: squalene/phytoene synthase family protein [Alphaproteobacteria bacterium]|nr:squalene/phytoene synthase family protein [Alphaproteobacteria bacterium]
MNNIKQIVKKSGTSFFWSMRFLPTAQRNAMYTIYAFCRHIDDIVDGDSPMAEKIDLLQAWREEMDNIFDKKVPTTEIGRKIYKNCIRFKLPKEEFLHLIDSIGMDVPNPVQAPDLNKFYRYCRGVAGVPGSLTLRILGCKDEQVINDLATSLGNALQITNILRDVKEDALNNRLYIPREYLEKAQITVTDPMSVIVDKNLVVAREELARQAKDNYAKADRLIPQLDKKISRHVRMIESIYRRYFDMMENRGWEVISPKPSLGKFKKLSLALRAYFKK